VGLSTSATRSSANAYNLLALPPTIRAALTGALLWVSGCFSASFDDGLLSCEDSRLCPAGFTCRDGRCFRPGAAADAAPTDAALEDGDAAAKLPASCVEYVGASGLVTIRPVESEAAYVVYCEMELDGGGWTVIANNDNADNEPAGCQPVIATGADLACGTVEVGSDFAVRTKGLRFTQLVWVTYNDNFSHTAAQRMRWNAPTMFPEDNRWSLTPDLANDSIDQLPQIECLFISGDAGLVRVANENPSSGGAYDTDMIITIFDQDLDATNPGKMSFTDTQTGGNSNLAGFDDFQDGNGCGDDFAPKSERGASSAVLVR